MPGLIGYRSFAVNNKGKLKPIVHDEAGAWARGVNQASSKACSPRQDEHPQAEPTCTCGFHAFYGRKHALREDDGVLAAVVATGRVVLCQDGWRASKAEIVAVLSSGTRARDERIRRRYDVPIVFYPEDLETQALRFGMAVTDSEAELEGVLEVARPLPQKPPDYTSLYGQFAAASNGLTNAYARQPLSWNPYTTYVAYPAASTVSVTWTNGSASPLWVAHADGTVEHVPPGMTITLT